jgi:pimeloyl-[acyl-carrier protein] methyl ester esterase
LKQVLLMLHGWGYDRHFWQGLREKLAAWHSVVWDLGFCGERMTPSLPAGEIVAIGHSYGLIWLLQHRPVAWRRLIGINGFTRFAADGDFPGVDPEQIALLSRSLAQRPAETLADFRQRQGWRGAMPPTIETERLQQALDDLKSWDHRGAAVDLALCGENDRLLPPALSRACFDERVIRWHPGRHLLPAEDAEWCAAQIGGMLS